MTDDQKARAVCVAVFTFFYELAEEIVKVDEAPTRTQRDAAAQEGFGLTGNIAITAVTEQFGTDSYLKMREFANDPEVLRASTDLIKQGLEQAGFAFEEIKPEDLSHGYTTNNTSGSSRSMF